MAVASEIVESSSVKVVEDIRNTRLSKECGDKVGRERDRQERKVG